MNVILITSIKWRITEILKKLKIVEFMGLCLQCTIDRHSTFYNPDSMPRFLMHVVQILISFLLQNLYIYKYRHNNPDQISILCRRQSRYLESYMFEYK